MDDIKLIRQSQYLDVMFDAIKTHLYNGEAVLCGTDIGGYDSTDIVKLRKSGRKMTLSFQDKNLNTVASFELELVDPDRYVEDNRDKIEF